MSINPRRRSTRETGQAITEFLIALVLVAVPALVAGARVLQTDWKKTQCAYQAFLRARAQVIESRRTASVTLACGRESEQLTLVDLESLDRDRGGLDAGDLIEEASRFWEELSSLRSRLPPSVSSGSDSPSADTSTDRSSSTGTAEPP